MTTASGLPPTRFWPVDMVKALPYSVWRSAPSGQKKLLGDNFFNAERFWAQSWDVYIFFAQEINPDKALLMLPEKQVHELIHRIRCNFQGLPLPMPTEEQWPGLVADFGPFGAVSPFLIPNIRSPIDFQEMKEQIHPAALAKYGQLDSGDIESLRKMVLTSVNCVSNKKKLAKEQKKKDTDAERAVALSKLQQQLGLRAGDDTSVANPSLLDVTRDMPFKSRVPPILVAFDVESWESDHNVITEIGISSLDVEQLTALPPGDLGSSWRERIKASHFRVTEYSHLVNHKYVQGCPDDFRFGTSEFVRLERIRQKVSDHFDALCKSNFGPKRPLVLIGHNPGADIKYLRQIGYNVTDLKNLVFTHDTAQLHTFLARLDHGTSLARILADLDIVPRSLHNAGNDAWYTLAAAVALAVAHRQGKKIGDVPEAVGGQIDGHVPGPESAWDGGREGVLIDI